MGQLVRLPTRAEHLLTKQQLAEQIGYSESWINQQMRKAGLPHLKSGSARQAGVRFRLSEVEAWMMRRSA
jgi:predicted DNA-binding transcriptional regulator AlpA